MKIFQRNEGNVSILTFEGRITIGDGDVEMRQAIMALVELGQTRILLDMARVSYMDSSGVGELLSCLTKVMEQNGHLKLLNLSTKIKNLLHIAQILSVFEYYNDEKEAVASFT